MPGMKAGGGEFVIQWLQLGLAMDAGRPPSMQSG